MDVPSDLPDRGAAGMPRVFRKGWDALSKNPVQSLRSPGQIGRTADLHAIAPEGRGTWMCRVSQAAWGGFSFGDFSLAKHKFVWNEFEQPIGWPEGRKPWMVFVAKVTRLSGRDPTSKKPVATATQTKPEDGRPGGLFNPLKTFRTGLQNPSC